MKEGLLRDKAEARMLSGKKIDPPPDLAEGGKGDVRDVIAKDAGVSHGTVDKFLFIRDQASEEEMKRLCSGELALELRKTLQAIIDICKMLKKSLLTSRKILRLV